MRVALIYNPTAGGGRRAALGHEVARELEARGVEVQVAATKAPGEGTRLAHEFAAAAGNPVDAVIAIGGDGTINEVLNGLHGSEIPLGIVPAGTANILALELDIPRGVKQACDVITAGYARSFDLGHVKDRSGGRYFVLMTGAGLDAATIRELDPLMKRNLKRTAFVLTGLKTHLQYPQPPFPVAVDGSEYEARFVVLGNCRYYGGRFGITIDADPTDGLLDVVLFSGRGTMTTAAFWLGTVLRLHGRHPQVTYLKASRIRLGEPAWGGPVWYQVDGELAGRLPVEVTVSPLSLRILVPEENDRSRTYSADRTSSERIG